VGFLYERFCWVLEFNFCLFDILGKKIQFLVFLRKHKIIHPNYCTLYYITHYTDHTKPYVLGLFEVKYERDDSFRLMRLIWELF